MLLQTGLFLYLSVTLSHADDQVTNEREISGKTALVTGGAQGIGLAIAENLLLNGVKHLIFVDKNETQSKKTESSLKEQYGDDRVEYIFGDITKDLEEVHNKVIEKYGYVDILVNNAGTLNEGDPELTLRTNAIGTVQWSLKFHDTMRKDKGGKGGTIINIASISGFLADPFITSYKASKYAIIGLSIGLGHEYNYKDSGVRVVAICPGFTSSAMTNGQMVIDEQASIFDKFRSSLTWQGPDHVGRNAITVFRDADTGSVWVIEENKDAEIAPDRRIVTLSQLESL